MKVPLQPVKEESSGELPPVGKIDNLDLFAKVKTHKVGCGSASDT